MSMQENKICSFFGHRTIEKTHELYLATVAEIMRTIELGCRIFYFGGFGEFDDFCYQIVTRIKKKHPDLLLQRIFCVAQEKMLQKKARYFKDGEYEDIVYLVPSFEYWYTSIYYRNCAMIDASNFVVFYAEERQDSGAYKAYKYAKKKKGKYIVNLLHGA